jgi:hypothetical protein
MIPNIHRLITSEHGENYWFSGCARYVMECLNEPDYDYVFFAGLTGDSFVQPYSLDHFRGDGMLDYLLSDADYSVVEKAFAACGYAATFVPEATLRADKETYLRMTMDSIDKGIPVIRSRGNGWHVFVGYENNGETLLYMIDNKTEPSRVAAADLFGEIPEEHKNISQGFGWVFVGEKKTQKELKQIYRDALANLPKLLTTKTDKYCFGAAAFRAWADDIENGKFDGMTPEQFQSWHMYITYVCNLATNSGGCQGFLRKAQELNPDLTCLEEVRRQYTRTGCLWNSTGWGNTQEDRDDAARLFGPDSLESLGGGFNITLEALQDKDRRAKIAAKIRQLADCMDEVVRILNEDL